MKEKIRDIINKGKAENSSNADRQEMLSLFHRPENEFEVKKKLLEDLQAENEMMAAFPDSKSLFAKLWAKIEKIQQQEKTRVRQLNMFLKIAAAVVIGLIAGILVSSEKETPVPPVYYAAHSPKGSVSEMILPDGSVIFLNADSRIRYSVDGKNGNREVFLEGEAWFEVEKNENKPFVVHTPFYKVNVTGTQFNVKAYPTDDEVTTTLEEGQVAIQSTENMKLAEDVILKPGEQVVMNKTSKEMVIKTVNTQWFTSWKDNKLIFVNMNLKDLVVLLERKYGVDIEIKNREILDLHFDGTIKNETIIEFLEIVKKTLPINYKIVGQKIEITDTKN
jgi:ferric-dicitrate binding protein FerR (iron transport regulator)